MMAITGPMKIQINGIDLSNHVSEMKIVQDLDLEIPAFENMTELYLLFVKDKIHQWKTTGIHDENVFVKPLTLREMREKRHPLVNPNGWKELCRL